MTTGRSGGLLRGRTGLRGGPGRSWNDGTIRAGCPNDGEGAENNRGDNERMAGICASCLGFASGSLHATKGQ